MKEFIEKLIGRLEEYKDSHLIEHDSEECLHCQENEDDWCNCRDCSICVWDKAVEIVNQLAEEYNNGWIPCSEKLPPKPENNMLFENKSLELYLATVKCSDYAWRVFWNGEYFTDGWSRVDVIAWQELPKIYKSKEGEL